MRIEVTQAEIAAGKRNAEHFCPVALAIGRATGRGQGHVSVVDGEICVGWPFDEDFTVWCMSAKVSRFVNDFDAGKAVKPFAFTLRERK